MLTAGHVNFGVSKFDERAPSNCNRLSAHLYCAPMRFWQRPDPPAVNETNLRAIVRPTSKDTRPVNLDLGYDSVARYCLCFYRPPGDRRAEFFRQLSPCCGRLTAVWHRRLLLMHCLQSYRHQL